LIDNPRAPDVIASLFDDAGKQKLPQELEESYQIPELAVTGLAPTKGSGGVHFYYRDTNLTYNDYFVRL